jgi:hypothetical protein
VVVGLETARGAVGRVVTGGQSGVDRAAVDVAIACGVPYGGWVPADGWAEDLPTPPGVLARYPAFVPLTSTDPAARTVRNAQDADAVLVLVLGPVSSPGTDLARATARRRGTPCAVVDLGAPDADARLVSFCAALPPGSTLNVAGPRESEQPGVYEAARAFLVRHAALLFGESGR